VLFFQQRKPLLRRVHESFRLRGLRQRQVVERVRAVQRLSLAARLQALCGVLPDRLKHQKARLLVPPTCGDLRSRHQQAVVHQRGQRLKHFPLFWNIRAGAAHRLCRFEGTATSEDGEAPEEGLLTSIEEVVAPRDSVAQRLLAFRQIARSSPEQL
jgi:hypothetical protein